MSAELPVLQDYVASYRSSNHKTGNIPTVSRPQWTCPRSCPLLGQGCYGENSGSHGRPSIFDMVAKSPKKTTMHDLVIRKWRKVPRGIRFGIVGDFLDRQGQPDLAYIEETNVTAASQPWAAWAYTHAWRLLKRSMFGYVVRASVQSKAEAEEAIAAGWRVALVDPGPAAPDSLIGSRIAGQLVVQCPATNRDNVTCESCLLCARDVATIVAFPVHGNRQSKAAQAVRQVREEEVTR